ARLRGSVTVNTPSPPCASSTVNERFCWSIDFTTPSACIVRLPSNGAGRIAAETSGASASKAPATMPDALTFIDSSNRLNGGFGARGRLNSQRRNGTTHSRVFIQCVFRDGDRQRLESVSMRGLFRIGDRNVLQPAMKDA